jgi:hypothetical protein
MYFSHGIIKRHVDLCEFAVQRKAIAFYLIFPLLLDKHFEEFSRVLKCFWNKTEIVHLTRGKPLWMI